MKFDTEYKEREATIFEMIRSLYKIDSDDDGILLRKKKGVRNSSMYFFDCEYEINEFLLKSIDWKKVIVKSNTIKNKTKNDLIEAFKPSEIVIHELDDKEVIQEKKKQFLQQKTKRDDIMTDEEKEKLPERIKELILQYGDINTNIGNSTIEKYLLYQEYTKEAEKEKESKKK